MAPEYVSKFAESLKYQTRYTGVPTKMSASAAVAGYGQHWGLHAAVEGLAAYQHWVSCMVLPIVFEWIEERHDAFYAQIPPDLHDDIDTVVKVAFEMIREKYEKRQWDPDQLKSKIASGEIDSKQINRTWTDISAHLRHEMHEASIHESEPLVGAVR